jgi:hypothetical protein
MDEPCKWSADPEISGVWFCQSCGSSVATRDGNEPVRCVKPRRRKT